MALGLAALVLLVGCGADAQRPAAPEAAPAGPSVDARQDVSQPGGSAAPAEAAAPPQQQQSSATAAPAAEQDGEIVPAQASGVAPQATDVAPASRLLVEEDLGPDWDPLEGRAADETSAPFEYCFGPFRSHDRETGRAAGELIRHTDGFRVQQQVLQFSTGGASASVRDFQRAVDECGSYTSSADPELRIEFREDAWAVEVAEVSGAVTFRRGELTVYTLLAAVRRGDSLTVLSVVSPEPDVLRKDAPDVLKAAVRRVDAQRHP